MEGDFGDDFQSCAPAQISASDVNQQNYTLDSIDYLSMYLESRVGDHIRHLETQTLPTARKI